MRQYILLRHILRVILPHDRRVGLVHGVDWVQNVIVQHQVLEVQKASYFLLLVDLFNDFLVLGEHVVLDDLFAQKVDDFVVVYAVSGRGDGGRLGEAEAALEG
jgi:hypothetical protein